MLRFREDQLWSFAKYTCIWQVTRVDETGFFALRYSVYICKRHDCVYSELLY